MSPTQRNVAPSANGTANAVNVAPPPLYYLVIDGMHELDSARLGAELEKNFGWKNLVDDFQVHPADPSALHDPAHPFLLLRKVKNPRGGAAIVVVTPNGENGFGLDKVWQHYTNDAPVVENSPYKTGKNGEFPTSGATDDEKTWGRHTAARHSFELVKSLFLRPATERLTLKNGTVASSFVEYERSDATTLHRQASIVQLSSHGFLGGMMAGDAMVRSTTATPAQACSRYGDYWLVLGKIAHLTFRGPLWIILAQCSTTNSACWTMWARMMAGSNPPVRGILAYEESAPAPQEASNIIERMMSRLVAGKTFLEAWKEANGNGQQWGHPWAAIVHRDAVGDTMQNFRALPPITAHPPNTPNVSPSYRGYLSSLVDGEDIVEHDAPFSFSLWYLGRTEAAAGGAEAPKTRIRVDAENLGESAAELGLRKRWQIVLVGRIKHSGSSPPVLSTNTQFEQTKRATLKLIHIRPTYAHMVNYLPLFRVTAKCLAGGKEIDAAVDIQTNVLVLTVPGGGECDVMLVDLECVTDPDNCPPIEPAHCYLWWRVSLETDVATHHHDFRTEGLSY